MSTSQNIRPGVPQAASLLIAVAAQIGASDIGRQVSWTMATDRDGVLAGGSAAAMVLRHAMAGDTGSGPRRGIHQLSRVAAFGAAWPPGPAMDWGWA